MNDHAGRILQAMDRLQAVLSNEFDDLTPPDVHFALSILGYNYLEIANKRFIEAATKR